MSDPQFTSREVYSLIQYQRQVAAELDEGKHDAPQASDVLLAAYASLRVAEAIEQQNEQQQRHFEETKGMFDQVHAPMADQRFPTKVPSWADTPQITERVNLLARIFARYKTAKTLACVQDVAADLRRLGVVWQHDETMFGVASSLYKDETPEWMIHVADLFAEWLAAPTVSAKREWQERLEGCGCSLQSPSGSDRTIRVRLRGKVVSENSSACTDPATFLP